MTKREQRFVTAMEHCVENGEYTADYAVTILEDNRRYGWMSEEAKNAFYEWLDAWEAEHQPEPAEEPETEPDPATEPAGDTDGEDAPEPVEEPEAEEEPEPELDPNTDPKDDPEPGEEGEPAEEEGE